MKRHLYILTTVVLTAIGPTAWATSSNPTDTVIIELDNNTRIVIIVKDAAALKELQNYDLNAMLKDLSMSIDSSDANTMQLVIEDEEGEKYISDTTIVVQDQVEDSTITDKNDRDIKIRLGTYRISGKVKDWDEYEDEFEKWGEHGPEFTKSTRIEDAPETFSSFDIELGTNNYLENGEFPDASGAPYAIRPWGSWYVSLGWTRSTTLAEPLFLEWGTNFSWYNFKFDNEQIMLEKGPDMVEFTPFPSEVVGKKSKLTASHINISLVPIFDFSGGKRKVKSLESGSLKIENYKQQGFRIGLGAYAGYRLGSHTKVKFSTNGNTDKDKESSNFFLENWRYGLRLRVGIKSLDLFANYDLNELFNHDRGPELNAFSFGIIL